MAAAADNLGAHMSIAGGLANAVRRGVAAGCGVVQIFVKNQLRWVGRRLDEAEALEFRRELAASGIRAACAHANYLINLAAPARTSGRARWAPSWTTSSAPSASAFRSSCSTRAPTGAPAPRRGGTGSSPRWTRSPTAPRDGASGWPSRTRPEPATPSARGPRSSAPILARVRRPERLAFCVDTCHLFAAGYDIRTPRRLRGRARRVRPLVGLDRLVAFHVNDSRAGLGSSLDRHENIGAGRIGLAAFRFLLSTHAWERGP